MQNAAYSAYTLPATFKSRLCPTALHPFRQRTRVTVHEIFSRVPDTAARKRTLLFGGIPFRPGRFRTLGGATLGDRTSITFCSHFIIIQ